MPTLAQAATDLYVAIKPQAKLSYIEYVASRTPAYLQAAMRSVVEADLVNNIYAPPVNVDAPLATQSGTGAGSLLNCTLGNWNNMSLEPHSYSFQWKKGAVAIGANSATYTVLLADVGATFTCEVTAINPAGSVMKASNAKVVA